MLYSHHRARRLTGAAVVLGALAIGTSSATASPRKTHADARTAGVALTITHRRKGLTAWRTQRKPNPTAPADTLIPKSIN